MRKGVLGVLFATQLVAAGAWAKPKNPPPGAPAAAAGPPKDLCDAYKPTVDLEGSAEFDEKMVIAEALGCRKGRDTDQLAWTYLIDRADRKPSEIVRAAHVMRCLPDPTNSRVKLGNQYLVCGLDARRLDRKALDEEIATRKLSAAGSAAVVQLFDAAKARAAQYDAWLEDAEKRWPGSKHLLVELPEKYFKEWDDLYAKNKDAIDEAYRIENVVYAVPKPERTNAKQTKMTLACDKLRKSWQDYVSAQKPASVDDVVRMGTDPVGFTLLDRLVLCDGMEQRWVDAWAEETLARKGGTAYRGPRYYVAAQVSKDVADLLMQKKEAAAVRTPKLQWGQMFDKGIHHITSEGPSMMFEAKDAKANAQTRESKALMEVAKVAAVKKNATGMLDISYATETWTEPDWLCTPSGRFNQWGPSGEPIYYSDCKVVGHHKVTFTMKPRQATPQYGEALKPGQIVRTVSVGANVNPPPNPTACVVEIDQPKKGGDPVPVSYMGVPLSAPADAKPAKGKKK